MAQYKINCEVDDPEGLAEGDVEIEVKIPFQPNFESDYWMSGPVIWEMNPDGIVEMSLTETMQTGLVINFFLMIFKFSPDPDQNSSIFKMSPTWTVQVEDLSN